MIRMEYPKANIEGLTDREKIYALKKQLDTLTNNVQLVLESIDGDLEGINEYIGGVPDELDNSVSPISKRVDELETAVGTLEERDYIVEEGTSGVWTYRKWNSGIAEAWYFETLSEQPTFTQQATNVYSATGWISRTVSFPAGLFIVTDYVNANVSTNTYVHSGIPAFDAYTATVRIWTSFATTPKIQGLSVEAKGRWK